MTTRTATIMTIIQSPQWISKRKRSNFLIVGVPSGWRTGNWFYGQSNVKGHSIHFENVVHDVYKLLEL